MIIILAILILSFLITAIDACNEFNWGVFIFVFFSIVLLFIITSLIVVYGGKGVNNYEPYFSDKIELEKITTEDRDIYLAATYEDKLIGYNINTENGFNFLTINRRMEIIEDGENYIVAHTKKRGGFWWTLFFSREVLDYYKDVTKRKP
jgi:hypothetical protein